MIRKIQWFAMAVTAVLCAACDAHIDVPDTAVRPGHILCEDGTALSYVQYEQSGKRAIGLSSIPNTVKVRKGTAMRFTCGTLLRRHSPTASVSHKGRRPTSGHWTGT